MITEALRAAWRAHAAGMSIEPSLLELTGDGAGVARVALALLAVAVDALGITGDDLLDVVLDQEVQRV